MLFWSGGALFWEGRWCWHRQKTVLHDPDARYFSRMLISKKNIKMPFCKVNFYYLYKGSSRASFVPMQKLWGPIQSPLDSVGSVSAGGLEQALWGWLLNSGGGKPVAVPQLWGGGGRIRPLGCQGLGEGPGNANQARGEGSPACSCSCCAECSCEHDPGGGRCRFLWKKKYREVFLLLPCSLPAPWKRRMHFVNSQRLQSRDGHFPFPCLQVKRELIVKYNMLLLWVLWQLKQI